MLKTNSFKIQKNISTPFRQFSSFKKSAGFSLSCVAKSSAVSQLCMAKSCSQQQNKLNPSLTVRVHSHQENPLAYLFGQDQKGTLFLYCLFCVVCIDVVLLL